MITTTDTDRETRVRTCPKCRRRFGVMAGADVDACPYCRYGAEPRPQRLSPPQQLKAQRRAMISEE